MKMFDAGKTRMIDDMLSCFHLIPERYGPTDRQTDRQTDRFAISISRISMLTRDKNPGSGSATELNNIHLMPIISTHGK